MTKIISERCSSHSQAFKRTLVDGGIQGVLDLAVEQVSAGAYAVNIIADDIVSADSISPAEFIRQLRNKGVRIMLSGFPHDLMSFIGLEGPQIILNGLNLASKTDDVRKTGWLLKGTHHRVVVSTVSAEFAGADPVEKVDATISIVELLTKEGVQVEQVIIDGFSCSIFSCSDAAEHALACLRTFENICRQSTPSLQPTIFSKGQEPVPLG